MMTAQPSVPAIAPPGLVQLPIETLHLPPAFLICALLLQLCLRTARSVVVQRRRRRQVLLLPEVKRTLLLELLEFELANRLLLLNRRGRRLDAALMLLHAELQLVLLLLALLLLTLKLACSRVFRPCVSADRRRSHTIKEDKSLDAHVG